MSQFLAKSSITFINMRASVLYESIKLTSQSTKKATSSFAFLILYGISPQAVKYPLFIIKNSLEYTQRQWTEGEILIQEQSSKLR